MTGILLVNMGGARSPEEMKIFLSRMFKDPFILPYGKLGRTLLSCIISNLRYKKSWKKYQLIGGTPIIDATEKTSKALQKELKQEYCVKTAFSYTEPLIQDRLQDFARENIKKIIIIPLYPQSSYSTTLSVENDINKAKINENIKIEFVKEFYKNKYYVEFWSKLITQHISEKQYNNPFLLFSAHSIPEYMINKGDTYPQAIAESATLIANNLNINFEQVYQSGMKRGKWIGPDIKDKLKEMAVNGTDEIVIIPLSFVNENLETLYDIDKEIVPFGKNNLGIKNISRVKIPEADETFIALLKNIIKNLTI